MSATRAWDRASSLPVSVDGRPKPEVAALRAGLPAVADLFTFMRDAELRFGTLRMRIEERTWTARGEEVVVSDVTLRHPGDVLVRTSSSIGATDDNYELWLSDGTTVRQYNASRKTGTQRPARSGVRGVDNQDLPNASRQYRAVTQLLTESLPDVFIHPAGYCQNVLATGTCRVTGTTSVAGREAVVVECDHPRTVEVMADRPDFSVRLAVDRRDGVILRLEESVGGTVTRDAIVTSYQPDAILDPREFAFTFPAGTTFVY
jgi:outer membrane lipoprotein-sorting protein